MQTTIIGLTKELLNCGVFSHLLDDEISNLHQLIFNAQKNAGFMQLLPLVSYWYKGDYFNSDVPHCLLQKSNEHLQRLGQPLIETYSMEGFFEIC